MLKLLSITLSRSSTLLSGDNYHILPEVLERLLPLLAHSSLGPLHGEATAVVCRTLSLVHATSPPLLAALARGTQALVEGGWVPLEGPGGVGRFEEAGGSSCSLIGVCAARVVALCLHPSSPSLRSSSPHLPPLPLQMWSTWRRCSAPSRA